MNDKKDKINIQKIALITQVTPIHFITKTPNKPERIDSEIHMRTFQNIDKLSSNK